MPLINTQTNANTNEGVRAVSRDCPTPSYEILNTFAQFWDAVIRSSLGVKFNLGSFFFFLFLSFFFFFFNPHWRNEDIFLVDF